MGRVQQVAVWVAIVGHLLLVVSARADDTDDAFRLCRTMESTGLTTECVVNGRTIDVTIDTNGGEARKICAGVVNQMAQTTRSFAGRWKLRVLSPYSGEKAIAVCTLQ